MPQVEFAPDVFEDFARIFDHMASFEVEDQAERVAEIISALAILTRAPLVGRPVKGKRELVIGQVSRGYVALYRFIDRSDTVFVLALRSQRESGYKR